MTRYEWRWLRRHPLRWLHHTWFHWAIVLALVVIAVAHGQPTFTSRLAFPSVWQGASAAVSGAVALSTLTPLHERIQAGVGAALAGLSVAHLTVYTQLLAVGGLSGEAAPVVWALMGHWTAMLAVAAAWPRLSVAAGLGIVVEAGQDDRGGG